MELTLIVLLVIVLALFFDFTNGFHDTANAMATPIATGALKPKTAVLLAAILNLVGAFLSTEVAKTISGGLINEGDGGVLITPEMIFAGLIGAIVWNLLTWLYGLPSSSSHALFGGLIGAAIVGIPAALIGGAAGGAIGGLVGFVLLSDDGSEYTGPGVDEATAAMIFDPFFTTKPVGHGTGLGLAISLKIVEEHDGHLGLLPVEKGASFRFELPLAAGDSR